MAEKSDSFYVTVKICQAQMLDFYQKLRTSSMKY